MAVPFSNTLVTITRNVFAGSPTPDPLDSTPVVTVIASGVRATVNPPVTATEKLVHGDRVVYKSKLTCDPTAVLVADIVADAITGITWAVTWVTQVKGLGMDHTLAGLRMVSGGV